MIKDIELMIDGILEREGGYVNHPSDPGGETNWGITKRVAVDNGYKGNMRHLTKQAAREIYYNQYIKRPKFDGIAEIDLKVAEEIIDSGVNAGPGRAARWFQQALNLFNSRGRDYADVVVDADIGPATLNAFRALRRRRGDKVAQDLMLDALDGLQFNHYANLAQKNSKFEDFMIGWTAHRIGNVKRGA